MSDDKDKSETRMDRRITNCIDQIENKIAIIVADSKGRDLVKGENIKQYKRV